MKRSRLIFVLLVACGTWYGIASGLNLHEVIPGQVYRSAQPSAAALRDLDEKFSLRSVINLRGRNPGKPWYQQEILTSQSLGLEHMDLAFSAGRLPPWTELQALVEALDTAPRPLLLHCQHGADRSGFASALLLMLEGGVSPEASRQQFSWRYRAFGKSTIGNQFLDQYQHWLAEHSETHSPQILRDWIVQNYLDANGNLSWYVDQINGVTWKNGRKYDDGYRFHIPFGNEISLSGWTVDRQHRSTVTGVNILIGDSQSFATTYGQARDDVAAALDDTKFRDSGWRVHVGTEAFEPGCYPVRLEVTRSNASRWRSGELAGICIDPALAASPPRGE